MGTPNQTVSVLFFFFSFISILCFFTKFDLSSIIYLLSDINQLVNRRYVILLCHVILLFIVKDSGLLNLSAPRSNEVCVYRGKRVVPLEKEQEFEVKEVRLERKEEIRESYIDRCLDMVVMEKLEEVIRRKEEEELEEDQVEVMESNVAEQEDLGKEEAESNEEEELEDEEWEVMEGTGGEEELEKESVGVREPTGEEQQTEKESVEEFNRKIEEFIEKFKRERVLEMRQVVPVRTTL